MNKRFLIANTLLWVLLLVSLIIPVLWVQVHPPPAGAQGMSQFVVMQAIERGQRMMRVQVENCQPVTLPPFVALPASGSMLLIDAWGDGLEVRAAKTTWGWRVYGVNAACPSQATR